MCVVCLFFSNLNHNHARRIEKVQEEEDEEESMWGREVIGLFVKLSQA